MMSSRHTCTLGKLTHAGADRKLKVSFLALSSLDSCAPEPHSRHSRAGAAPHGLCGTTVVHPAPQWSVSPPGFAASVRPDPPGRARHLFLSVQVVLSAHRFRAL